MPRPRNVLLLAAATAGALAQRRATDLGLAGRQAVVTGAGSGIGRSLALELGRRGATVVVADLDLASVQAVAQEVRAAGGRASAHGVDVTDADAVQALADRVLADGPVALLCNNAGIGLAGQVVDMELADWRRLVEVNLMGVVHGLHAFLPALVAQAQPSYVLNTASMAGLVPVPGLTAYSATKAAVVGLSEALDLELEGSGVRAAALCPGVIDTAIVRTSTMRGEWASRQARTVELYRTRGTSPDVVARQALDGLARGQVVIASPRYQVVPHWVLKRVAPPAGRAASRAVLRFAAKE